MIRTIAVLALVASASDALAFAAPDADEAAPYYSAYLTYPANGAVDVPANTLVFAVEVTAMQLQGPGGETITCLLDPAPSASGTVFEPTQLLEPGAYHALGLPSERSDNYAGPGLTIDLGTFTVIDEVDEQPASVTIQGAGWLDGPDEDLLSFTLALLPDTMPSQFEIDLGDADTLLDGTADLTSPWMQATFFSMPIGDDAFPQIDPEVGTVRVRAVDATGNVGEWSAPTSFSYDIMQSGRPDGCSAAPGRTSAGSEAVLAVLGGLFAIAARRRRRGSCVGAGMSALRSRGVSR